MSNFIIDPYMVTPSGSGFDLTDLKAYYKFDNASGNLLNKASTVGSSDSNGVDFGNTDVTQNVTGLIDKAYDYTPTAYSADGAVSDNWEFLYNTTSGLFTFIGWFKQNIATASGNMTIFDNCNAGSSSQGFLVFIEGGNGARHITGLLSKSDNSENYMPATNGQFPSDTDWHMLYVSWSASTNEYESSVDDGTKFTDTTTLTGLSGDSGTEMSIGASQLSASPPVYRMNGLTDEFSFWNRLLTDEEITSLYNSGAGLAL